MPRSLEDSPLLVEEASRRLEAHVGDDLAGLTEALPRSAQSWANETVRALEPGDIAVLQTASLLQQIEPKLIAEVCELVVGDVLDVFDRAYVAGIMQAGKRGSTFAHPSVVEALHACTSIERRFDLHLRIASKMSTEASVLEDEVALHLLKAEGRAASYPDAANILRRAAGQSLQSANHRLAARFAEAALRLDPNVEVATTHYLAAVAHFRDYSPEHTLRHLEVAEQATRAKADQRTALDLARVLTLRNRLALGTDLAIDSFNRSEDLLQEARDLDGSLAAQLCEDLSEYSTLTANHEAGAVWADQSLAFADEANDAVCASTASFAKGLNLWMQLRLPEASDFFRASQRYSERGNDPWFRCWGSGRIPIVQLMEAHPTLATATSQSAEATARAVGDQSERVLALGTQISALVARGRFDEADGLADLAVALLDRTEYAWATAYIFRPLSFRHAITGDTSRASEMIDLWAQRSGSVPWSTRPYLQCLDGLVDRASLAGRAWRHKLSPITMASAIWSAELIGDSASPMYETLRTQLTAAAEQGALLAPDSSHLVQRAVARLCRLGGDLDDGRTFGEAALETAQRSDLPIEAALVAIDLAETFLQLEEMDKAIEHLELAAGIAASRQLVPVQERCERAATQLGVRLASEPPLSVKRSLLFTDIVQSTTLVSVVGDAQWVRLLGAHDAAIKGCLPSTHGHQFTHTGDGIGAWFASPHDAVACADAIHAAIVRVGHQFRLDLGVRIGIVSGEVIERGSDLSGLDVARANRVMAVAGAGETVVDASVAQTASNPSMEGLGTIDLRGISEPQELSIMRSRRLR